MHQLAAEIDAAPSMTTLLRSPRVFIAYALGQAYIPFFRLQGPFASAAAWRVAAGELFEPVVHRGAIANFIFVVTMAAFAFMNIIAHIVELLMDLMAPKWMAAQRAEVGASSVATCG